MQVIGLTFDGFPANISMCQKLNADVFNNKAFFEHPAGSHVFVFLNATHMLKLLRNVFASKRILYDHNGDTNQYNENFVKLDAFI